MADNLLRRTPEDPRWINLNEDWEIRYWTEKFNCTLEELKEAVKVSTNSSSLVKWYFENFPPKVK